MTIPSDENLIAFIQRVIRTWGKCGYSRPSLPFITKLVADNFELPFNSHMYESLLHHLIYGNFNVSYCPTVNTFVVGPQITDLNAYGLPAHGFICDPQRDPHFVALDPAKQANKVQRYADGFSDALDAMDAGKFNRTRAGINATFNTVDRDYKLIQKWI